MVRTCQRPSNKHLSLLLLRQRLRLDFTGSLETLRADETTNAAEALAILGQFGLPPSVAAEIETAWADPANAKLRPQLAYAILNAHLAAGGVDAAKKKARDLEIGDTDVAGYLVANLQQLIAKTPSAALEWLSEVQEAEGYAEILPTAVAVWAHSDYGAAGQWLRGRPQSPARAAALARYVALVAPVDPDAAQSAASKIADPEQREAALSRLKRGHPGAAPQQPGE